MLDRPRRDLGSTLAEARGRACCTCGRHFFYGAQISLTASSTAETNKNYPKTDTAHRPNDDNGSHRIRHPRPANVCFFFFLLRPQAANIVPQNHVWNDCKNTFTHKPSRPPPMHYLLAGGRPLR